MTDKKSKENFEGVMIDEELLSAAFIARAEAEEAVRTFVDRMEASNTMLLDNMNSPFEEELKQVKQAVVTRELKRLLPGLRDRGLYTFSNSLADGLQLLGKKRVVEETPDKEIIMEPKEHPLTMHKRLVSLHYDGSKSLPSHERPGYELSIDCINFLFRSLTMEMRDNNIKSDVALGQLECKVSDYETYIRDNPVDNSMEHLSEVDDLFKTIIATLVDDIWLLGETSEGDLTIKPFSKGITSWDELKKPQEHIVLLEFDEGRTRRIDKVAHLR